MYQNITSALTLRVIKELREFWGKHPTYRKELTNNIQGKHSFRTRPQMGIIVKNTGTSLVRLTWDNYMGDVHSYATIAKVAGHKSLSLEWLREDPYAINKNSGYFPSLPGVYYLTITEVNNESNIITFTIKPYYNVFEEKVYMDTSTLGMLTNSYVENSLSLYQYPEKRKLIQDINYITNGTTGEINLINPLEENKELFANYKYEGEELGPFQVKCNHTHKNAIPGLVLAFGTRAEVGDTSAIIITKIREPAYKVYGNIWESSFDIEVFARDVNTQREIFDFTINHLWNVLRPIIDMEGINMTDISGGGEAEEQYDDVGDDYYYYNNITFQLQTESNVHHPIVGYLERFLAYDPLKESLYATLSDEEAAKQIDNSIKIGNYLIENRDPFFQSRSKNFELIR